MASVDYVIQGDPEVGRQLLSAALTSQGFAIESQAPNGTWSVGRGSKVMTVLFGAFAGRNKQRLVFTVSFFAHEGNLVARVERESGGGAMGGAIGVARSQAVFTEVTEAVGQTLAANGVLVGFTHA